MTGRYRIEVKLTPPTPIDCAKSEEPVRGSPLRLPLYAGPWPGHRKLPPMTSTQAQPAPIPALVPPPALEGAFDVKNASSSLAAEQAEGERRGVQKGTLNDLPISPYRCAKSSV
jgi:hypothetical protein